MQLSMPSDINFSLGWLRGISQSYAHIHY